MKSPRFALMLLVPFLFGILWLIACNKQDQQSRSRTRKVFAEQTFASGSLNPMAPGETEQLGQLVGIWEATKTIRNRDGTWSKQGTKAEWRWYYILYGHAIQDDWLELSRSNDGTEIRELVGTNFRIYNPDEKQWHMAWIDKNNRRLATFTAVNEDDKIIMTGHNARGQPVKNTFLNITRDAFDWKQEWTFDRENSWVEVARIHCERKR